MADEVYENALRRREVLRKELRKIEDFLALYDEFRIAKTVDAVDTPDVQRPEQASRPKNPSKEEVAAAARQLMIQRQRPMTRGELVDALKGVGMEIHGADPSKVIGTMLWRVKGQFRNIEGLGYWPTDVQLPQSVRDESRSLWSD